MKRVERHGLTSVEIDDFENVRDKTLCLRCKDVKRCNTFGYMIRSMIKTNVEAVILRCHYYKGGLDERPVRVVPGSEELPIGGS
jgi:hypothetical protein